MNYMYGPNSRRRHDVIFGRTDQTGQGDGQRRRRPLDPLRAQHNQDAPPSYEEVMRSDRAQRRRRTARRFMRRVAEFGVLSQLSPIDELIFRDWLYRPNGQLRLGRAFQLACLEQQWRQRYNGPDSEVKPSKHEYLEFFKFCVKVLKEKEGKKKEVKKVEADPNDPTSPAYQAGYQEGLEAARYESLEKRGNNYDSDSGYYTESDDESDS